MLCTDGSLVKLLHRLLSARAFIRTALLNIKLARSYLPPTLNLDDIKRAEQIIEESLYRVESEVRSLILDKIQEEDLGSSRSSEVSKIIAEVVFS